MFQLKNHFLDSSKSCRSYNDCLLYQLHGILECLHRSLDAKDGLLIVDLSLVSTRGFF